MPNSMCSVHQLRVLELARVRLPEGDSNGELTLSYPALENLRLKGCDQRHIKIIILTAPYLKILVIESSKVLVTCEVKICSPQLMFLRLCTYCNYSLGNLSSLVTAEIGFMYKTLDAQWLIRNLESLRNVSTLQLLGFHQHQTSPEFMHTVDHLLHRFSNLRCLKLFGLSVDSCVPLVAHYVKSAPCVETLVFGISQGINIEDKENDWEKVLSVQYSFHHLKYVQVERTEFREYGLQTLAFLLKTSVVLEKITVTYSKWTAMVKKNELAEFEKKLHYVSKASSKVRIRLLLDSDRCKF